MEEVMRIGQLAVDFDISPTTLRRWTERYADFLSDQAVSEREYTQADVALLRTVESLRQQNLGHDEIESHLREVERKRSEIAPIDSHDGEVIDEMPADNAVAAITHLLQHLDETNQSVLNTQLANRDMLGVVIQDNFNLKEENARLRKRLRALEHEMSRLKESDWNHRLSLEERLTQLERELEQKKPWWKRIFGL